MRLDQLPTPALLLDRVKLERNLERMARRAGELGVALRPHVKTHKSIPIGRLQLDLGAHGITVATLAEARAFAEAGFEEITWAFPVILSRLPEMARLADTVELNLLVDSPAAVEALEALERPLSVFLKVDCGYHRAGVDPASPRARDLARRIDRSPRLGFAGLLTHAGHAYHRRGRQALLEVARQERDTLVALADELRDDGIEVPTVSVGSTPTMSTVDHLEGVDEIRPGNYVFYDLSQVVFGSCEVADCALTVLASVVSVQPAAGRGVIDAGALALSKDAGPTDLGHDVMGALYADYGAAQLDSERRLVALSQEHGIVEGGSFTIGERVRVLPNHSCLTAAQFDVYTVVEGETVIDRWPIDRRR